MYDKGETLCQLKIWMWQRVDSAEGTAGFKFDSNNMYVRLRSLWNMVCLTERVNACMLIKKKLGEGEMEEWAERSARPNLMWCKAHGVQRSEWREGERSESKYSWYRWWNLHPRNFHIWYQEIKDSDTDTETFFSEFISKSYWFGGAPEARGWSFKADWQIIRLRYLVQERADLLVAVRQSCLETVQFLYDKSQQ